MFFSKIFETKRDFSGVFFGRILLRQNCRYLKSTRFFGSFFCWEDFFLSHTEILTIICLRACNEHQVPWILDPVAAGFTPLRCGSME